MQADLYQLAGNWSRVIKSEGPQSIGEVWPYVHKIILGVVAGTRSRISFPCPARA